MAGHASWLIGYLVAGCCLLSRNANFGSAFDTYYNAPSAGVLGHYHGPQPQYPPWHRIRPLPPRSPVDLMSDVINRMGTRILQQYVETGNVAFSPAGIGFILAALYEGSGGRSRQQIIDCLGLPRDRNIVRMGLRDIHRRLRTYLNPDGFLGGLNLNRENTTLRPDFENILRIYGFDLSIDLSNFTANATGNNFGLKSSMTTTPPPGSTMVPGTDLPMTTMLTSDAAALGTTMMANVVTMTPAPDTTTIDTSVVILNTTPARTTTGSSATTLPPTTTQAAAANIQSTTLPPTTTQAAAANIQSTTQPPTTTQAVAANIQSTTQPPTTTQAVAANIQSTTQPPTTTQAVAANIQAAPSTTPATTTTQQVTTTTMLSNAASQSTTPGGAPTSTVSQMTSTMVPSTTLTLMNAEATTLAEDVSTVAAPAIRRRRSNEPYFNTYPDDGIWMQDLNFWADQPFLQTNIRDATELQFLVNGCEVATVPAATYTTVLPFAYFPALKAVALEFPLDNPRYNVLLFMPTERVDTGRLARELGGQSLRLLRRQLQPTWVRATIPSFMLRGFVTLTPYLQRLGVRDVFEPRLADLSPMTPDLGVYARDVQQSIAVNIRNYMKSNSSTNGNGDNNGTATTQRPEDTLRRDAYRFLRPANGLLDRIGLVSFTAEHPFLYFIIDDETSISLIAGRIDDPLNSRIL